MNGRISLIILFSFGYLFANESSHILIFTYSYNRPDFIEIQSKTFKKFLKDDYEFIVFNDAKDNAMAQQINNMCAKLAIRCVRIPQSIHTKPYLKRWPHEDFQAPAVRNSNVVMYSLNEIGFKHDGIVVLLDSDMFLIRDFSIHQYLHRYDLAGLEQERAGIIYLWIGLAFLDMRSMPNSNTIDFNCGKIGTVPVDAGGQTAHYLRNNHAKLRLFEDGFIHNFHYVLNRTNHVPLDDRNIFFHYYAGTNWTNYAQIYHTEKTKLVNSFIAKRLETEL